MTSIQCFISNDELRRAVIAYVQPGVSSDPNSDIAITYGWPINNWCVSKVSNFSHIFTPPPDDVTGTLFNETISDWDMTNATILSNMFEGAFAFDQDISSWDLQNVVTMDRMFIGAYAFNRDLCEWVNILPKDVEVNVTDMFLDTSCPDQNDPLFVAGQGFSGPLCYECVTGIPTTAAPSASVPTAAAPTPAAPTPAAPTPAAPTPAAPTPAAPIPATPIPAAPIPAAPTPAAPTPAAPTTTNPALTSIPSNSNNFECFQTRLDLELALTLYLQDNGPDTSVATQYGWPINNWCVTNVTDFSTLFSPVNNLDKATFNEDISRWDMSNALSTERMFERNTFFNRDVSAWNFGMRLQNSYRMFFSTSSFNQNLCRWGQGENPFAVGRTNTTQMFRGTSCPSVLDPFSNNETQSGPFCYNCPIGQITSSPTPRPTPLPTLSPVASPTKPVETPSPIDVGPTPTESPMDTPTESPIDTPPEPGSTPSPTSPKGSAIPSVSPPTGGSSGSTAVNCQRFIIFLCLANAIIIAL